MEIPRMPLEGDTIVVVNGCTVLVVSTEYARDFVETRGFADSDVVLCGQFYDHGDCIVGADLLPAREYFKSIGQ